MTPLVLALSIPWVGGVILTVVDGRRTAVRWAAIVALVATLACLLVLGSHVLTAGPVEITTGNWPIGVGITLRADALGVTFAVLSVAMLTAAAPISGI